MFPGPFLVRPDMRPPIPYHHDDDVYWPFRAVLGRARAVSGRFRTVLGCFRVVSGRFGPFRDVFGPGRFALNRGGDCLQCYCTDRSTLT